MVKKLVKHGKNLALILDRHILETLRIDDNTLLDVRANNNRLIVTPVLSDERRRKFLVALEEANRRYGRALKKLAE